MSNTVKIPPIVHVLKACGVMRPRKERRDVQTSHYVPLWPKHRIDSRGHMYPDSKYTGSMLRVIRAANGVGRPVARERVSWWRPFNVR